MTTQKPAERASGPEVKRHAKTKRVIGYRKSCEVGGTGLSHYVLLEDRAAVPATRRR